MPDLTSTIETESAKSQSTAVDGVSSTRRSLESLIKADQYLRAEDALATAGDNGGPQSGWCGAVRPARFVSRGDA